RLDPDVLTLDVEMPRMDGLSFLRNLMRQHPRPVVMVSSLTEQGASVTLDALASGAVDFIGKPRAEAPEALAASAAELRAKVLARAPARGGDVGGASAGGAEPTGNVLAPHASETPAVAIAQHIPAPFSAAFADRPGRHCALDVAPAVDGEPLQPGRAYVAPGG